MKKPGNIEEEISFLQNKTMKRTFYFMCSLVATTFSAALLMGSLAGPAWLMEIASFFLLASFAAFIYFGLKAFGSASDIKRALYLQKEIENNKIRREFLPEILKAKKFSQERLDKEIAEFERSLKDKENKNDQGRLG